MPPSRSSQPKVLILSLDSSTKKLKPKRGRVARACNLCRLKKKRCDGLAPCNVCKVIGSVCVYLEKKESVSPRQRVVSSKPLSLGGVLKGRESLIPLPEREVAIRLIHKTWNNACVLFRFHYRPSIIRILNSLYEITDPSQYTEEQIKAQPLIYSVLAVGVLFAKEDLKETDVAARDFYQDEGYKYFLAAKSLVDVTNISDVFAIQTMFMMTMFLQCSANLKNCYSYIGIALRAAISEGLHRKNSLVGPTPIEDETKKRLFWTIYKVDLYMNCILGLPQSIAQSAVNQEFPRDIDDERITENGIVEQEWGKISSCGMNNQHTKLMLIMASIHKKLYPVLKWDQETYINILALQDRLDQWFVELPLQLKPDYKFINKEDKDYYLKPKKLLYLDYLLAKIILYKPFIHYIAIDPREVPIYKFQISMARNCIQVAHDVISLSNEMMENNLLSGSYWYSIHTIFFSVTCLMFYQHQINLGLIMRDGNDVEGDCNLGIEILLKLKNASSAGERSFNVLNSIFKEFNKKTTELFLQVKENLQVQESNQNVSRQRVGEISLSGNPINSALDSDELLDQLLQDFDIPISNILPDFEMTSFFPKLAINGTNDPNTEEVGR